MSPEPDGSEGPWRVLLVEDSVEDAFLIRSLLQGAGPYQVELAQDGDSGIRRAREEEWDLVLTDLNLPGASGLEVIEAAREGHPERVVLATTAYTGPQWEDQAVRHGANDVVRKPIDRDDLLRKVEEHLHRAPETAPGDVVLAVGARAGDVEAGCGGALLTHLEGGETVVVVLLDGEPDGLARARDVAGEMGARFLPEEGGAVGRDAAAVLEQAARELSPVVVYAPSRRDRDIGRRTAYQIALEATIGADTFLCYETASTPVDFHPSRFVDVSVHLERKIQLVEGFGTDGSLPHLNAGYLRAAARHWGRFADYGLVEALEVVRSES